MFRLVLYLCFTLVLVVNSSGQRQVRTIKPVKKHPLKTNLSIGIGITNSAVFLQRNTLDDGNVKGLTGCATYDLSKIFRVSLDYTRYNELNIAPTWYNIHASTVEMNLYVLWHSKENLCFYPLTGLSLNRFEGYFTGLDDYQHLSDKYRKDRDITTLWLGVNAGLGFEYMIKPIIIFGSYKMRIGYSNGSSQLNIVDVCFSFGVRYNLRVPSFYKLFRGTRNRYFLDADK